MSYYKYTDLRNTTNIYWDPKSGDSRRTFRDLVERSNLLSDVVNELISENTRLVTDNNLLESEVARLATVVNHLVSLTSMLENRLHTAELRITKLSPKQ